MKKNFVNVCALCIALTLTGCGASSRTAETQISESEISELHDSISSEIDLANELKDSVFAEDYDTEDLDTAIENAQEVVDKEQEKKYQTAYDALTSETQKLEDYIDTEGYAAISKLVEKSNELKSNYFAKYYNTSILDAVKNDAQAIINRKDVLSYAEAYDNLSSEYDKLSDFISDQESQCYNDPISNDADHPFAVEIGDEILEHFFEPIKMQSSATPQEVLFSPAETTDGQPYANLFIDNSSANYSYTINTIDTKEVQVQTEDGSLTNAYVNTEVDFTIVPEYSVGGNEEALNQRPAYFISKDGSIELLLQSYDGDTFYIVYQ